MSEASPCPDLDALQRLAANQASPNEALALHRHLVRCVICNQTLKSLRDANVALEAAVETPRTKAPLVAAVTGPREIPAAGMVGSASFADAPASPGAQPAAILPAVPAAKTSPAEFLAPPQAPDELGRLGPYRVLKILGTGGMGMVFLAEDPGLQRLVALKALRPHRVDDGDARERFLIEARAAASIEHDHIVTIYQVGEDRGVPYLAMQYLQGENLEERMFREKRLPISEAVRIIRETAEGLAAAHDRGLIHRDIKPSNLWLEAGRGRVKILDFGLARASRRNGPNLTEPGFVMGTAGYMAPEQARGQRLDARCDLFSLGCVAYEICTGRTPFPGNDSMSRLMAVALDHPLPPRQINPDIPPRLAAVISAMLGKAASERPDHARVVVEEMQIIARELCEAANGETSLDSLPRSSPESRGSGRAYPTIRPDNLAQPSHTPLPPANALARWLAFAAFAVITFLAVLWFLR
jgi:serine/threonine protein kinase